MTEIHRISKTAACRTPVEFVMNPQAVHAGPPMKILIVKDRPSAGGGIHNYYNAIGKYLGVAPHYTEVGRQY
jgi:hypothetical protein